MSREKIGTIKKFEELEKFKAEITLELVGELKKGDKIAILGPVAYNPVEIIEIKAKSKEADEENKREARIVVESNDKINAREKTTVYKID
ncbi:MAG: hypothetical protein ACOCTT_04010 [archaeon]